jgi:hypothetical protein
MVHVDRECVEDAVEVNTLVVVIVVAVDEDVSLTVADVRVVVQTGCAMGWSKQYFHSSLPSSLYSHRVLSPTSMGESSLRSSASIMLAATSSRSVPNGAALAVAAAATATHAAAADHMGIIIAADCRPRRRPSK